MSKVSLVDCDIDPVGRTGQLSGCVDYAAVVFVAGSGSEHKQSVRELLNSYRIHRSLSHGSLIYDRFFKARNSGRDSVY